MIHHQTTYLSLKESSVLLGYTKNGVRKAILENRIDAYKIGSQYVIRVVDIKRFVKKGRHYGK